MNKYFFIGISIYISILFVIWLFRPSSTIHRIIFDLCEFKNKIINIILCVITIMICIIPMSLSPAYNGKDANWRNQYELMADAMIDGHIYFDYEVDERLLNMDNPYDP